MPYFTPQLFLQVIQNQCRSAHHLFQVQTLLLTSGLLHPHFPISNSNPNRNSNANATSRSTFFYNTLIRAHLHLQNPYNSLLLFTHMLAHPSPPNSHTFPSLIQAASSFPPTGKSIHAQVIRRGLSLDLFVNSCTVKFYAQLGELPDARQTFDEIAWPDIVSCNSMLDALCKNGDADSALNLFGRMPERDVVSWTSIINGFARNRQSRDAIQWFGRMITMHEVRPNEATLVSILSACANLDGGALYQGRQIHAYVIKSEVPVTTFLGTALIDMYGKSSCLGYAWKVFREMTERGVCTWNAIISSLASNSRELEALDEFEKMRLEGMQPNGVTYVGLLTACARAGLVELGLEWFNSMSQDYGIVPTMEHYGCVVDLLGRAGLLEDAAEFIRKMPMEADATVWGALLGACKVHGNVELGGAAGQRLIELQPRHSGWYVVLSNMYAGAGRWGDATLFRELMAKEGVKKSAGYSRLLDL
ncbi:putative pentatricopeptide repeat-containing protein At1g10330 [Magnolia sinica]|uniref:putative pentatricopeptide repeat-containing protein At1g10330 n=1 Tax=Magnolia sinica TaxID=86752 RepID=UPI0026597F47|nr:putative pentatricopeptide repeat-containing protein At1g10330 [Magnolia sinica]